jgi:hypothetical protein
MPADVVFRVGRAYGMTADRGVYEAVAVKDGRIIAAERSRDELDSLVGPGTVVIDLLDLPVDDLPSQQPALTVAGRRPVHDPDGLFGAA